MCTRSGVAALLVAGMAERDVVPRRIHLLRGFSFFARCHVADFTAPEEPVFTELVFVSHIFRSQATRAQVGLSEWAAYHASPWRSYHWLKRKPNPLDRWHSKHGNHFLCGFGLVRPCAHVGTIFLCPQVSTKAACGQPGMTRLTRRELSRGLNFGGGTSLSDALMDSIANDRATCRAARSASRLQRAKPPSLAMQASTAFS